METGSHHVTIDDPSIPLLDSLNEALIRSNPTILNKPCIYRVPPQLFEENRSAYTPKVISIGPIHHGKNELKALEELKLSSLKHFLDNVAKITLREFWDIIAKHEKRLRESYAVPLEITGPELVKIITVDAAFLADLMLTSDAMMSQSCKKLLERTYLMSNVVIDLLLLENQLPLFILLVINNEFHAKLKANSEASSSDTNTNPVKDQLDRLVKSQTGITLLKSDCDKLWNDSEAEHLLDILWRHHKLEKVDAGSSSEKTLSAPSLTQLNQAGAHFNPIRLSRPTGGSTNPTHLLQVKFNRGVLSIPEIFLGDSSETVFRNLLAFEKCHYPKETHFADYFYLMNHLINSSKDVDLLIERKIITNTLGDSSQAADMFNNIAQGLGLPEKFCYGPLCEGLNDYQEKPWNRWKTTLKDQYFNTPWAVISVIAAVILLVLTVIQTVFTVI